MMIRTISQYFIYTAVLLLSFLWAPHSNAAEDRSFAIVIPSSNNRDWVKRNLDSVFSQSHDQFRIIYVDDASTDGTGGLVNEYIQKNDLQQRVTLLHNEEPEGSLSCLYRAVQLCSPDEIVVPLEGCDWFAHRQVLAQIDNLYADPDVWLTYGGFCNYPDYAIGGARQISQAVIEKNEFRSNLQATPSLKSFYAGLFRHINKQDLPQNAMLSSSAADLAISFPLLEMAGAHSRHIPDVSYVYNTHRGKSPDEDPPDYEQLLRAKEKYRPLAHYKQEIPPKRIYITPGLWGELFSISNPIYNRDNCLDVLYRLREAARQAGYELHQADNLESLKDFEYLIVFDVFLDQLDQLSHYPKEKKVLFLWEPPSVLPENFNLDNHSSFSKVYTWHDGLVDNKKYFKFFYPVMHPMVADTVHFQEKNLCTLIACNKESYYPGELYSERLKLIHFYEFGHYDGFTLYGKWWPRTYRTYAGPIDKKVDCLKFFRFCYSYENVKNIPGYVTEKIFDCFHAGTVPIYWGAPNISDYIPKSCFIFREDFADDDALYSFLRNMDETRYQGYIENIQKFLSSQEAQRFSQDHFISVFMQLISNPPSSPH